MKCLLLTGMLSLVGAPIAVASESRGHAGNWAEIPVSQDDPSKGLAFSPSLVRYAAAEVTSSARLPRSLVLDVRETQTRRKTASYVDSGWTASEIVIRWLSEDRILLTGTTNRKNTRFCVVDATSGAPVVRGVGTKVVSSPDGSMLFVLDAVPGGFIPAGANACAARLVVAATGAESVLEEWRIGSAELDILPAHASWTPSGAAVSYLSGEAQSRTLTVWEAGGEKRKRRRLSLAGQPEPVSWAVSSDLKTVAMSYQDKIVVAPLEVSSIGSRVR